MRIIEEKYTWNGSFEVRARTDYIVQHHAVASICTAQDVHTWHLANGWAGIGYHFFVRKDGAIYRGRPLDAVGAHVYGYNRESIGICAEGDFEQEQMSAVQLQSLIKLVDFLRGVYPAAKVLGHSDLAATDCPGKNFPLEGIQMDDRVQVLVKGREVPGRLIGGTTWVPLRAMVEALAHEITWDEATKTARVD